MVTHEDTRDVVLPGPLRSSRHGFCLFEGASESPLLSEALVELEAPETPDPYVSTCWATLLASLLA